MGIHAGLRSPLQNSLESGFPLKISYMDYTRLPGSIPSSTNLINKSFLSFLELHF